MIYAQQARAALLHCEKGHAEIVGMALLAFTLLS